MHQVIYFTYTYIYAMKNTIRQGIHFIVREGIHFKIFDCLTIEIIKLLILMVIMRVVLAVLPRKNKRREVTVWVQLSFSLLMHKSQ